MRQFNLPRLKQAFGPWDMALAELELMNFHLASDLLLKTVEYAQQMGSISLLLNCIPLAAMILAHNGEPTGAVELLGLVFTDPRAQTGWMEKWPRLTRLRNDLEAELGAEAYQATWDRGSKRDLDSVIADLLVK